MSEVRLSNGSPTLERTEPRVADHPKPSACRSLFGSVDHDELTRDLKGHLRQMEADASAKWGFDFANHTPLPGGRLRWELVDCRDVPEFYRRHGHRQQGVRSARDHRHHVDVNGNRSCPVAAAPPAGEAGERCEAQPQSTEPWTGMRKRPACHDATAQNKRPHSSSGSSDDAVCRSRGRCAELTPTKSTPTGQT